MTEEFHDHTKKEYIRKIGESAIAAGYSRLITIILSTLGAPIVGFFLSAIWSDFHNLEEKVDKLNNYIVLYDDRFATHNARLDDHEIRLRTVEKEYYIIEDKLHRNP